MASNFLKIVEYTSVDKHSKVIKWTLINSASEDIIQRILPAFYFDIIVPIYGYLIVDNMKITEPFVSPILLKNKLVTLSGNSKVHGLRFNPIYFKSITGVDPQILRQRANILSELLGVEKSADLINKLSDFKEGRENLSSNCEKTREINLLKCAVQLLIDYPYLKVKTIAKSNKITERWLQKLFKEYFNITPTDLKKLVKFSNSITSISQLKRKKLSDIAHDNSYFDQSHFIKSFKTLSGLLPSQFAKLNNDFFSVMNSLQ